MTSSKIWIKVSPHLAHRSIVFLRWVVLHYLAEITRWTRTQSAAEVTSVLINNEIAAHSVQSSAECLADTQLAHRKSIRIGGAWWRTRDLACREAKSGLKRERLFLANIALKCCLISSLMTRIESQTSLRLRSSNNSSSAPHSR